ncbi:MAG: aspartate/glutamate racemase family protein [Chloroflexi bacterium]|nr:aspartate/glutamate racemase family protein [Chloroflexota bacterium]
MAIRTRIGLLVPSTNSTAEPDFQMVAPKDVTIHSHRLWLTNEGLSGEGMDRMNAEVEQGATYLATAKVNAIAYACTTGSFYKGPGYDQEMVACMKRAAGAPAVATAPAMVQALRFFGARSISVATPYNAWQNDRLREYFSSLGFRVLNVEGEPVASRAGAQGHCDQPPESVLEFASRVCHPEADVLLCPCTAWRSLEVVKALEERTGKPVVSANQATIWATFRRLDIIRANSGFGSLIDSLAKAHA